MYSHEYVDHDVVLEGLENTQRIVIHDEAASLGLVRDVVHQQLDVHNRAEGREGVSQHLLGHAVAHVKHKRLCERLVGSRFRYKVVVNRLSRVKSMSWR